jgi:Mlc titration factor MtfA (ptsG expression regulator)
MLAELAIVAMGATVPVVLLVRSRQRRLRRLELMQRPLPDAWRDILERTSPLYTCLPGPLRHYLDGCIQVFLDEKNVEGCGGLEITDDIRVTIAAQACLLLIGRRGPVYPKLRTILVYPHTYVADSGDGPPSVRLGESWQSGVVVLSWNSVKGGAANIRDGHNVTVHEFAHQLDQEDGAADGTPLLDSGSSYRSWATHLSAEYAQFLKRVSRGRKTVVDRYGATNPAEFFATATEAFLEKPRQLARMRPDLYEELMDYYQFDPRDFVGASGQSQED